MRELTNQSRLEYVRHALPLEVIALSRAGGNVGKVSSSLPEKVASVFSNFLVDGISFDLHPEGLLVNPIRLREVGKAIAAGRIKVVVASTGGILSAAYSPHSNTMTITSEKVLEAGTGRSGVLHEGVHALVDLYKCTSTTSLTDEAAAYLAETIYLRAGKIRFDADAAALKIYDAADELAKARGLYKKKRKPVRLARADYEPLREAIRAHPAYSGIGANEMTSGHGIP